MPKPGKMLSPRRKPPVFAQALEEWLERADRSARELAGEVGVNSTVVFRWRQGLRIPSDLMLLRVLLTFHRWLGEAWSVEEALDGIAPLGWDWDTAQEKADQLFAPGEIQAFREWWETGRPTPCSLYAPYLPAIYVERAEQAFLAEQVTAWAGYRQPRWRGIVVHGVAGAGKTTLAAAVARDETVRRAFRDGVLWLGVDETKDLLHLAARRSGPKTKGHPVDEWAHWAMASHRRLLIIVDDVVPGRDAQGRDTLDELRRLLRTVGPLVVVVVTTQQGAEVRQEMERWLGPGRVTEIALGGMSEEEGLHLVERVLERPLADAERAEAMRVGALLGWHPEGLRLATAVAGEAGWSAVLEDLDRESLGAPWERMRELLERQWGRIGAEKREWMERLIWRTARGGPLGLGFAAAVLGTGREQARWVLADLERTGMVERLTGHPVEWWRKQEARRWRVTPVVYRLRRKSAGKGQKRRRQWDHLVWWARMFLWISPRWVLEETDTPPMPGSLGVMVASLALFLGMPKLLVYLLLLLVEGVVGRRGWARRLDLWMVSGSWFTQLRVRLERLGLVPMEEYELVYRQSPWRAYLLLFLAIILLDVSERFQVWVPSAVASIVLLGLMMFQVAWIYWLNVLYGVRAWDLALMVKMALGLCGLLRWIPAMREERERLEEAWRRWEAEGNDDR